MAIKKKKNTKTKQKTKGVLHAHRKKENCSLHGMKAFSQPTHPSSFLTSQKLVNLHITPYCGNSF